MDEARPGYGEIKAASVLHPDSGAWAFFMREIMRLPAEMTPAVSQVLRLEEVEVLARSAGGGPIGRA